MTGPMPVFFSVPLLERSYTARQKNVYVFALRKSVDLVDLTIRSGIHTPDFKQFIKSLTEYILNNLISEQEKQQLKSRKPQETHKLLADLYDEIVEMLLLMNSYSFIVVLRRRMTERVVLSAKNFFENSSNENAGPIVVG